MKENGLGFKQVYTEFMDELVDKYFVAKLEILNGAPVLIGLNFKKGQVFSKKLDGTQFDFKMSQLPRSNLPRMQASSGGSPDKAIQDYYPEEGFLIKSAWLDSVDRHGSKLQYLVVNFDHQKVTLFSLDTLITSNHQQTLSAQKCFQISNYQQQYKIESVHLVQKSPYEVKAAVVMQSVAATAANEVQLFDFLEQQEVNINQVPVRLVENQLQNSIGQISDARKSNGVLYILTLSQQSWCVYALSDGQNLHSIFSAAPQASSSMYLQSQQAQLDVSGIHPQIVPTYTLIQESEKINNKAQNRF